MYIDGRAAQTFGQATCVIAHELAHVVLDIHHVRLSDTTQHEELTDTVAVFGGFGRIMMDFYDRSDSNQSSSKLGYLDRSALRRLSRWRADLAKDAVLRRYTPINRAKQHVTACPRCGQQLRLPELSARILLRCPVCNCAQQVALVRGESRWAGLAPWRIGARAWTRYRDKFEGFEMGATTT